MTNIRTWLEELDFAQYADEFEAHAIDISILPQLDLADLKEIGVLPLGHRKRILAAIASESAEEPDKSPDKESLAQFAQKRNLTVLFADLVDYTGLTQVLDAETLRSVVRAYQDTVKASIERYDGYVAKYLGDGVLSYFGFPNSHEDDVERAIRAASELTSALVEINEAYCDYPSVDVRVRVAIETGTVIVGDVIGSGASFEHTVIGEAPNLAARAQQLAEPGSIVIGPGARNLIGRNVQTEDIGVHELKGFHDPIQLWKVTGLDFAGGRFEKHDTHHLSQFMGRQTELTRLNQLFHGTKQGDGAVVEIEGEAGIGKSRLVHEFLTQRSATTRILPCHCASHADTTAFFPFIDMLKRQLGLEDRTGDEDPITGVETELRRSGLNKETEIPYIINLLGLRPDQTLDPDTIGQRTEAAIRRYIYNQGQVLPTILLVNDLHWIDAKSQSVLNNLVVSGPLGRMMVLYTYRPGYTSPWAKYVEAEHVELTPLPPETAVALIMDRFPQISTGMVDAAVSRAGGNPLFIEELAGHLSRKDSEEGNISVDTVGIPDTVTGLLLERVDALSTGAQSLARIASVAGRRFSIGVILEEDDYRESGTSFEEFFESGLIVRDGPAHAERFRFKNSLVQDAIYDSLLTEDRARLHKMVGEQLETLYEGRAAEFAETLASHFEIAGENLKAARYAFLAGNRAFDLFALEDADHWFRKSVDLYPSQISQDDEKLRTQAISNHIQISCWDSRFSDMIKLADDELKRIDSLGDSREVSHVISWLGEGHLNCCNFDTADQFLAKALEMGERVKDIDAIGHALAEQSWLFSITLPGDSVEAMSKHTDRVLNIAENTGNRFFLTLANYGKWASLIHGGYITLARQCAERLIDSGSQQNYPPALNWGYSMLAYCEVCEEKTQSAHRYVEKARQAAQCRFDHLMTDLCVGIINAREQNFEAAQSYLCRSQRQGDEVGSLFFAYAAEAEYGRSLAEAGRLDEAIRWLEAAYEFFHAKKHFRAATMAGKALGDALVTAGSEIAGSVLLRTRDEAATLGMHGLRAETIIALSKDSGSSSDAPLQEAAKIATSLGWQALNKKIERLKR